MNSNILPNNIFARMQRPGSAAQLAVFRIVLGMQIFYVASSELFNLLQVVDGTEGTVTIFPEVFDALIADYSVPYLVTIVKVLSVFLILGLFTRVITPVLFVSFVLLFSFWYSNFNAPIPWLYIWFPLLVLCFCRTADRFSLDQLLNIGKVSEVGGDVKYRWPIELIIGWFAYIYFAAGLAKVFPIQKGLYWLEGTTSQKIIYERFLDSPWCFMFESPLFDYSTSHWVFGLLSISALLIELICLVLFFTNRFNNFILFLIMCMHFFLYLTGVGGFMQLALILSICLLPPTLFGERNQSNPLARA